MSRSTLICFLNSDYVTLIQLSLKQLSLIRHPDPNVHVKLRQNMIIPFEDFPEFSKLPVQNMIYKCFICVFVPDFKNSETFHIIDSFIDFLVGRDMSRYRNSPL